MLGVLLLLGILISPTKFMEQARKVIKRTSISSSLWRLAQIAWAEVEEGMGVQEAAGATQIVVGAAVDITSTKR